MVSTMVDLSLNYHARSLSIKPDSQREWHAEGTESVQVQQKPRDSERSSDNWISRKLVNL